MDYAPRVGELQATAGLFGNVDGLLQGQAVVGGILDNPFNVAAAHQLGDHVGLVPLLTKIEHGDDVRVGTEAPHSLGLSRYAAPTSFV